ncbi:MAG TPA: hypothetical protein VFZ37_01985 [Jiangellaceae bacterium]
MKVRDKDSVDTSQGISRRTMLRRSALAGGSLVWAAPVVQTIAAPSAAAGTPLQGISYVAVVLKCGDEHYRMKWEVESSGLVMESGLTFKVPDSSDQLLGYPNLQPGAAPEASAALVGEVLRISARDDCVLVDFVMKHGGGTAGPGTPGQPVTGTTGPWDFQPLPSPPSS